MIKYLQLQLSDLVVGRIPPEDYGENRVQWGQNRTNKQEEREYKIKKKVSHMMA